MANWTSQQVARRTSDWIARRGLAGHADIKTIWSPITHGLSFSGLVLWLQDRAAFGIKYLDGWQESEVWEHKLKFGNLVGSAIEGYINSGHQIRGLDRFLQHEYRKQESEYGRLNDMIWWTHLARHLAVAFVDRYSDVDQIPLSAASQAERNIRVEIDLPSGRKIVLNCYLDGDIPNGFMEIKARAKYDPETISREIRWDLQYNIYTLAYYMSSGEMPKQVWYQHIRRPCGWGYRGPQKRKKDTNKDHLKRICDHVDENPDYYFYRFIGRPQKSELDRFVWACLYPMLEGFLDWYEYKIECIRLTAQNQGAAVPTPLPVNKYDWVTPYGLYHPFVEGTKENFRDFRLTGNISCLIKRERDHEKENRDEEKSSG